MASTDINGGLVTGNGQRLSARGLKIFSTTGNPGTGAETNRGYNAAVNTKNCCYWWLDRNGNYNGFNSQSESTAVPFNRLVESQNFSGNDWNNGVVTIQQDGVYALSASAYSTTGGVASATIVNAGVGYTVTDTVSIAGTSVGGFDLSQGKINTVGLTSSTSVPSASSGTYTNLSGTSAQGTGAIFTVFRDASGGIGTVSLTNPGEAYGVGTTITINGDGIGGTSITDDIKLNTVSLRDDKVVVSVEGTNSRVLVAGVDDWYNNQTLGLDNSKVSVSYTHLRAHET